MAALTLTEVKNYLRYEDADTSNNTALNIIIDAGQRFIENYTGHILVQREVVESPVSFPTARRTGEVPYYDLRYKPYVADSLEVGYLNSDHDAATFEDVTIYANEGVTRVIPTLAWPGEYIGISFTYTAGYASAQAVPDDLLLALAAFAAGWDEDRGGLEENARKSVEWILASYRCPVLA